MKMKRQLEQTKIEARDMQERYARAEERCRNLLITIEELEAQVGQAQAKFVSRGSRRERREKRRERRGRGREGILIGFAGESV